MNTLEIGISFLYVALYFLHITLGPYFMWFFITGKPLMWKSRTIKEVLKRMFWLTYLSFLMMAYYMMNPTMEMFILTLVMSLLSTIGYTYKFSESPTFFYGVVDHVIYLLTPLYLSYYKFEVGQKKYKRTIISYIVLLYLSLFIFVDNFLYKDSGGKDIGGNE